MKHKPTAVSRLVEVHEVKVKTQKWKNRKKDPDTVTYPSASFFQNNSVGKKDEGYVTWISSFLLPLPKRTSPELDT